VSRAELLVPEGWRPRINARVSVLATADEPAIPGAWRLLDRSPGGPGPHWWAQPADDAARAWAQRNPGRIVQGCLEVKGLRCVPPGTRPRPSSTRAGGRR
jgi:hypothetical protein